MSESLFSQGFRRAVAEVLGGIIFAAVMGALTVSPLIPADYKLFFGLIAALPSISLVIEMRAWNIIYTAGWMLGVGLMINAGLLPPLEIAIFLGIPSAIWGLRLYIWLRDEGHI